MIQGDGGFMLSLGELATAVQERLPVITCVFNDRGYGILRFIQDLMFEGRRAAVDLHTPDFAAWRQSMGMPSWSVASADEFDKAFAAAVDTAGPWLIDVDITSMTPIAHRPAVPERLAVAGRASPSPPPSGHSPSQRPIWSPWFSISRTWVTRLPFDRRHGEVDGCASRGGLGVSVRG